VGLCQENLRYDL